LGLSQPEYEKLLKQTQPVTFIPIDGGSSDAQGGNDDSLPLSETLSDPTEVSAPERAEKKEKVKILRELIKNLPDQSKKILMLYYYEELKLSEIAQIFSLTEGRISQILSHSLLCLRSNFQTLDSK
jgi:RNA polymerase sigma factor FliA